MADTAERKPLLSASSVNRQHGLASPAPSFPASTSSRPMRPKIERPPSSYRWSSFPFDPPPTPAEERAERQRGFFSQLIWPPTNEELAYPAVTYDPESGLPRLSRACLASEVRCYGRFIIPTLFVFGLAAIVVVFYATGWWRW